MWITIRAEIETEGYTIRHAMFTCHADDVAEVHAEIRASAPQGSTVMITTTRA